MSRIILISKPKFTILSLNLTGFKIREISASVPILADVFLSYPTLYYSWSEGWWDRTAGPGRTQFNSDGLVRWPSLGSHCQALHHKISIREIVGIS